MPNATVATMADSNNTQALVAAFTFGMVVNAASGAVFLYLKGHASSLWRDGLRLVLVIFLATSALWAQTDFITTLISVSSSTRCQVAIVFASIFDQVARVSLQQAIIWAINHHDRVPPAESMLAQVAVLLRLILGGVFVGLQRPQLDNICLTSTSVLPYGVVLLTADFAFTTIILARAVSFGILKEVQNGEPGSSRSKAAVLIILGFGTWTGTSIPLVLGVRSVDAIARTAVPATGLSILIGILTLFKDSLTLSKGLFLDVADDTNPQGNSGTRDLQSRDISTADTMVVPPTRYEEAKDEVLVSFKRASQFKTTALKTTPGVLKSTLPVIARPDAGQAITGIGGVPVQGQFFPPIRSQTLPVGSEVRKKRQDLFGKNGTKMVISGPVMTPDSEERVLAKIPTMNLDTAVLKEKQRVASGRIFAPSIRLASRMDSRPPPIPQKAARRTSQIATDGPVSSTNSRKAIAKAIPTPPIREISIASTSSVMLSPALEELRKRSPRQERPTTAGWRNESPRTPRYTPRSRRFESPSASPQPSPMALETKPLPKDPPYSVVNFSVPVDARKSVLPMTHQQHSVGIRPSRAGGASSSPRIPPVLPSSLANSPVLTPTKFGLPTNPRESRARLAETQSQRSSLEESVMLFKTTEHKGASIAQRGVAAASKSKNESVRPREAPAPSRIVSVIHRPRPIPRWRAIDRAIFPAEGSPNMHEHKRSLSSGGSKNKKSMMVPSAAKSAGLVSRSQRGDARSMTWDEKMNIFYPDADSPRSSTAASLRRRSRSVPDVPILSMFVDDRIGSLSPHSFMQQHMGDSARTSLATQSITISNLLEDFPRPHNDKGMASSLRIDLVAQSTDRNSGLLSPRPLRRKSPSRSVVDRRSSPVLPPEDLSLLSALSETRSRDDDASTNWGSIHSPVTFVNVQKVRAVEVPGAPKEPLSDETEVAAHAASPLRQDEGVETLTVLDEATPNDGVETASEQSQAIQQRQGTPEQGWHRRVGEECPTFSERGQTARPRKMPPPAPLLLSRTNKVPMAIQAQPLPLETPSQALAAIQEQLDKMEDPGSEQGDRAALLDNLETELGQQENQWHGLRGALMVQDSPSTPGTATPKPNPAQDGRSASFETALRAKQEGGGQESLRQLNQYAAHSPSPPALAPTGDRIAQQQLDQGQAGYVGIRSEVPTRADIKEKWQLSRLASSADLSRSEGTDDSRCEYESRTRNLQIDSAKTLWCPIPSNAITPGTTKTLLWTPVKHAKVEAPRQGAHQLSTTVDRRRFRPASEPLSTESLRLWQKPSVQDRLPHVGLWRSSSHAVSQSNAKIKSEEVREQPPKAATTRRPPRRTKRVTLLPDILESPKPIPDKRGTLGIFQFPWGEMSDIASVPARPSTMMAMPGMMTSMHGGFGPGPTSFLDDYEAEEDGDSDYNTFSESEDEDEDDEDDGFDETVLWEIASLLKPSHERRNETVLLPTEGLEGTTHQRGEDSAARLPPDAPERMELVRRDNSEASRLFTTNFASSETEQTSKEPEPWHPRTAVEANTVVAVTASKKAPTGDKNAPTSDSPHATVTPTDTDLGPRRRLQGVVQANSSTDEVSVRASTASTASTASATSRASRACLNSATDDGARTLSPKTELINASDDNHGDSGDGVELLSNMPSMHMPVPLPRGQSLPGAPMTTAPLAHETGVPHVPPVPVPPAGFGPPAAQPQEQEKSLTWAWTLNSDHTESRPSRVPAPAPTLPALPVASRVLLPSADISAISSATAQDDVSISTAPSDSSPTLPDFFFPSPKQSPVQLSPRLAVPQHQNLLRNAYTLSSLAGPMAMLWSPPTAPVLRPSKGLPQPDAETWNSYLRIESTPRAQPRTPELVNSLAKKPEEPSQYETPRSAEPATLKGQSLWTKPAPAPAVKNDGHLWTSSKAAPKAVNFGLWAPSPAIQVDEEPAGLFSLAHRRSDYRTSSLTPAALHLERKPRAPVMQPSKEFVFAHLWNQAPLWDAAANAAKVKEQEEMDALVHEGLFSLDHRRNDYRTSSAPPVTLTTRSKPHISQYTPPKFKSDSLWSVQSLPPAPVERDWLAICSSQSHKASSVASSTTEAEWSNSTVASSVTSDDATASEKPARRVDASPSQWLEALEHALAAGRDGLSKDQAPDSSESPSSAYQLWTKRDDAEDNADDDSASLWKPSSSNKYLILTPTTRKPEGMQPRASGARRRSSTTAGSAFASTDSETPRDFGAQGLWSPEADAMEALEDERTWLEKSLRNSMALV